MRATAVHICFPNICHLTGCINTQAAPVNIMLGTQVWVEDPNVCWIEGVVTKITGQEVEVETTDGKKVR